MRVYLARPMDNGREPEAARRLDGMETDFFEAMETLPGVHFVFRPTAAWRMFERHLAPSGADDQKVELGPGSYGSMGDLLKADHQRSLAFPLNGNSGIIQQSDAIAVLHTQGVFTIGCWLEMMTRGPHTAIVYTDAPALFNRSLFARVRKAHVCTAPGALREALTKAAMQTAKNQEESE